MENEMLSIIIPVFNEANSIQNLLKHLINSVSGEIEVEIILVDGGSNDKTPQTIEEFISQFANNKNTSSIHLLYSEKGRAKQMNYGAKMAKSNILYFLHADSFTPKDFDQYILNEIRNGNPSGCFRMKFDSKHWWLQLAGWLTQFNWKISRGGDQSLFITKTLFEEIGGFDENYIIYEDNILINELYKRNKFVVIQHSIITSARRYREHGVWVLQYHFWAIHLKKWLGADAEELYLYYSKHIGNKN